MKHRSHTVRRLLIFSAVVVVALIALDVITTKHAPRDISLVATESKTQAVSEFTFAGTPGWHQGPSNNTSMALFADAENSCFTSIEHKSGSVDITAELSKQRSDLTAAGSTVTVLPTQKLTLSSSEGPQSYDLYQFSISGGSTKPMEGLQLGYITLPDGYIIVQGHCHTAAQLPSALPALQAYKYIP